MGLIVKKGHERKKKHERKDKKGGLFFSLNALFV